MNEKKYHILAKPWFATGDRDLSDAILLFKEGGYSNTICFLCQQAVEKYLKGSIVYNGIDIKDEYRIHDLSQLIRTVGRFVPDIGDYIENVEILTTYYIESRYPPDSPMDYPKDEVKRTIESAEEIISAIKRIVKL